MNFDEIISLKKAFKSVRTRQQQNTPSDLQEKIKKLKTVREFSVGNEALLKKAIKKVEENGIKVFLAKDKEDAVHVVLKEIGNEKKRKIWEVRGLPVTAFQKENLTRNLSSVSPAGGVRKTAPCQSIFLRSSGISGATVTLKRLIIF